LEFTNKQRRQNAATLFVNQSVNILTAWLYKRIIMSLLRADEEVEERQHVGMQCLIILR